MFWLYTPIIWCMCYFVTAFYWGGMRQRLLIVLFTILLTIVLIYEAGMRSLLWPDTLSYAWDYLYSTPSLMDLTLEKFRHASLGYAEFGFFCLSAFAKMLFGDNYHAYFTLVAFLSIGLLYVSLRKYCVFPLIGLLVYLSRFFMGREMMQIRAGLAIAIVVYALQYIERRRLWVFVTFVVFAAMLHRSAILVLPVYWMFQLKITNRRVLYLLGGAFVIAMFLSTFVSGYVEILSEKIGLQTYTMDSSEYTRGQGLANPMIYFQTTLLLLFVFNERRLSALCPYYATIRNGYLYATLILIIFSSFGTLSGRTSTIYATFEVFIVPALLLLFTGWKRIAAWGVIGVVFFIMFYLNYTRIMLSMS